MANYQYRWSTPNPSLFEYTPDVGYIPQGSKSIVHYLTPDKNFSYSLLYDTNSKKVKYRVTFKNKGLIFDTARKNLTTGKTVSAYLRAENALAAKGKITFLHELYSEGKMIDLMKVVDKELYKANMDRFRPARTRLNDKFTPAQAKKIIGKSRTSAVAKSMRTLQSKVDMMQNKMLQRSNQYANQQKILGQGDYVTTYGDIRIGALVYDSISPKLVELQVWQNVIITPQVERSLRMGIPHFIKARYKDRNYDTWPDISPDWKEYKRTYGYDTRILHMHDTRQDINRRPLSQAVDEIDMHIKVTVTPNEIRVDGLEEGFADVPHVWFHETGMGQQERSFIAPAIDEAFARAVQWLKTTAPIDETTGEGGTSRIKSPRNRKVSPIEKTVSYPMGDYRPVMKYYPPKPPGHPAKEIKWVPGTPYSVAYTSAMQRTMMDISKYIWWFLPPSQYWAYLGMYAEAKAIIEGHLLTPNSLLSFATAYLKGRVGGYLNIPWPEKVARRRMRYTLYPQR